MFPPFRKLVIFLAAIPMLGTAAATVGGFFGGAAWPLDLFSHFRVFYLVALFAFGVVFLFCRAWWWSLGSVLLGGVNLAVILPYYAGGAPIKDDGKPVWRAVLANVNSTTGSPQAVLSLIADSDPHIVLLEEVTSGWIRDLAPLEQSHPYTFIREREDNFGIALYSKVPLDDEECLYLGGAEVPTLVAVVTLGDHALKVCGTHPLPPIGGGYSAKRDEQFELLATEVALGGTLLLLGDLNATPWSFPFRQFLDKTGLSDSAVGFGIQPTWPAGFPILKIPIDHCLHSQDVRIVGRKTGRTTGSDHLPLIIDFQIE